ncbi:MAG: glutaredoxin [Proteobacteria bacterium]|nr:glutaredoxin [Pseudomonadota bacterium]
MSVFAKTGKRALKSVLAGLNRADEIGGEIRDIIVERMLENQRYVALRKRIAAARGKSYTSRAEAEAARAARRSARAAQAPPPAASVPKPPARLGDPDLPAQIYGKTSCPWTGRAIRLLEDLKVDYDFIDLDEPDNDPLTTTLVAETTQNTVPFIYVRGQFVGGFNALDELQRVGRLEYLLMTAEQRKEANPALANIAVTPRPNSDDIAPGEVN